ncbi:hypothetical protein CNMCM5793_003144 [Aspergillus hiratsukae]|uniref:Uncharacterized protein n=1 Tax=Aspergillus hiratsukae TaxID=1194566 RepID=A0A8H6UZ21_9EURO|nr:hypothetical protein CNMCM5793_003144 [Aspergillus hiratsukae]KAF7171475.1 hypothetical protein CNMCM6106_005863 [Aspergillus hiratsukae]
MKLTFLHFLYLYAATLAVLVNAKPTQQKSLLSVDVMSKQDKVAGHSDAIYDPVPKQDQLFKVEFLEVAPTPIPSKDLALPDEGLVNATLTVGGSVVYPDGSYEDPQSVTGPFKTTHFNDLAHLTIRDARGTHVDYLPSSGRSDILLDFQLPTIFVRSGTWTFNVDTGGFDKYC